MVIMITGERNIGKTTIIDKVMREFSQDFCGFCTREFFKNGMREGFFIKNIANSSQPSDKNIIAKMDSDFKPIIFTDVFETHGVKLAKNCLNSQKPIVIIDEIGVFESNSQSFVQKLDEILLSDKIVIAVLKSREHFFLDKYKKLYKPLEINEQNRDDVAQNIIDTIRENL